MNAPFAFSVEPVAAAFAIREACLAELRAFKPGNVSFASGGHGMQAQDFVVSADAISGVIAAPASGVGERILRAIKATRAIVSFNTNLGIVLLCAPLVHAAIQHSPQRSLEVRLQGVLEALDVRDAELAYQAIRTAEPGGLGRVEAHDVAEPPGITLLQAMREARQRDRIAAQYATNYHDVLKTGVPLARHLAQRWGPSEWVTVGVYVAFLARFADSHIARRHGNEVAHGVMLEAMELEQVLNATAEPGQARPRLEDFDRRLKSKGVNPGSSADLTVATLAVILLDDSLEKASRAPAPEVPASESART